MYAAVSQHTYPVSGIFHTMCSSKLAFPQSQSNSIAFSVSEKALCNCTSVHMHLGEAVLNCKAIKQLFPSYGATT